MNKDQFVNRELSWLEFNARVLQEAQDSTVPLIERLRFIGIFSNNLDEFYKVRYATVKRIALSEKSGRKVFEGQTAKELLKEITQTTIKIQDSSIETLNKIIDSLAKERIYMINEKKIRPYHEEFLSNYFINYVSPNLVTVLLNERVRFPNLKDKDTFIVVRIELKGEKLKRKKKIQYALIEIPSTLDRFIVLPSRNGYQYFMMVDDLIRYQLHSIFSVFNYQSLEAHMIKISRDAELEIDEDLNKSYVEQINESISERLSADPVRFEYDKRIRKSTLNFLLSKLEIDNNDSIIPGGRYHNRRDYINFPSFDRYDLLYPPITPLSIKNLSLTKSVFGAIKKNDYLLYTPYHTFSYLVKFLREAALDPKVRSIKITIYRLSKLSNVASSLIQAVRNGKKVTVLIELQARFDEKTNIKYAEEMEDEGVHIIFGIRKLKIHSKICVVRRKEDDDQSRLYGFIATGNLNESTAKRYTDYILFTSNQAILKEVDEVFDFLDTSYKHYSYKHLILSPHSTLEKLQEFIDEEIAKAKKGNKTMIKLKLNNLSNTDLIQSLYRASMAGVKIQIICRGICCLIPDQKKLSENIKVISIIDQFLEHPRVFIFGQGNKAKVFISSADWMDRNLHRRVEVTCPIYDEKIKKEMIEIFDLSWQDNVKARLPNNKEYNRYNENQLPPHRSQSEIYEYYLRKIGEY